MKPQSDCDDESPMEETSIAETSLSVSEVGSSDSEVDCGGLFASCDVPDVVMTYCGFAKASLILGKNVKLTICRGVQSQRES